MNIGPMGMIGSTAGSPLAQGHGSDVQRAHQESADQARQTHSDQKAEDASGVGETEQDEQASDRDADGRRLWEKPPPAPNSEPEDPPTDGPQSKDPTGLMGGQLDLSG